MPQAAVDHLAGRLNRCMRQDDRNRLVELACGVGPEGLTHLRRTLVSRPASEAASTVGLLSRLDPRTIEEFLPSRLREWDRANQDQVVRYLANAGAAERGRLLAKLLEALDTVVLAEALDEIGMSGDRSTAPKLLQAVEEELQEFVEPGIPWAHIDAMAWNNRARPGRPEGAEASALRTLYAYIATRFGAD
jgi:hypothetical protein